MFNFDLSGIQLILLLLKFCGKSLSKTSYLFRKQLIVSFSFNRQQFLHSFDSTTLYFKETTLDDIKSCDKKRKKTYISAHHKDFIKSDSSATKCSNHSRVHFSILIFKSLEKFWWKAKRKSISRMVIKKLTATKGASSIALHTNLLCR
mgnify:CR=1 FL=1